MTEKTRRAWFFWGILSTSSEDGLTGSRLSCDVGRDGPRGAPPPVERQAEGPDGGQGEGRGLGDARRLEGALARRLPHRRTSAVCGFSAG